MDLTAVLITGLFAGGVSCAAVQSGLPAGLITRQRGDILRTTVPVRTARHRRQAAASSSSRRSPG